MTRKLLVALLLLAVAAVLALLAADVLGWRDAIRSGDRRFAASPSEASWHSASVLPGDPAKSILALDTPLGFRVAQQSFVAVEAAGTGYDNGISETKTRGELESQLSSLARGSDHEIASAADNLLGILAYADATPSGPIAPAPVDQAVADFGAAIQLDPTDVDAKINLELLLDALRAKGSRSGPNNSVGGPAKGHSGAGGGIPGRGY